MTNSPLLANPSNSLLKRNLPEDTSPNISQMSKMNTMKSDALEQITEQSQSHANSESIPDPENQIRRRTVLMHIPSITLNSVKAKDESTTFDETFQAS